MKNIKINDLVAKVNIVDIIENFSKLTKFGSSLKTLCNVHGDKTPSLSINPKKQIYKCFVCDHGGNALDYLMWAQNFSWNEAVEYLIKASGENIEEFQSLFHNKKPKSEKEIKLLKALQEASDIFNYYINIYLEEKTNDITNFVHQRKLSKELINKFKLGYAPNFDSENNYIDILEKKENDKATLINASILNENGSHPFYVNRLIFPIIDEDNNIVAFSGRKVNDLDDKLPKYLNSKESLVFKKSSFIYNYNNARKFDSIITVEGFMDVISLAKLGYENAVALMGLYISKNLIDKLKNHKEILLCLDNDEAGINATMKLINVFLTNNINAFVIVNKEAKDVDEIINSPNGKEKITNIFNNKVKMIDFIWNYFSENIEKDDYQQIKDMIIKLANYSKDFDQFLILDLSNRLSKQFEIDKEIISNYFKTNLNMVKSNHSNNNISVQNGLENSLNQPININKILISIWQNPSFLKSQNIVSINWPEAKYKKIYEDIKKYHENKIPLPKYSQDFIDNKIQNLFSKESLPKNILSFDELIVRSKKDFKKNKLDYIDYLINNSNDEEHASELLKIKLDIKSRKE